MRILRLNSAVEKNLLRARHERDLEAERVAAAVIGNVRKSGDAALVACAKKFDSIDLCRTSLWISEREIVAARKQVSLEFLRAVRHAKKNIRHVAEKQLPRPWSLEVETGVTISQLIRPIDSIGCYIPGGRFALVSTLLMTVIPAQVAGVPHFTVVCPKPNHELLAAASLLGIEKIARIGGAQAIAALAYGTKVSPAWIRSSVQATALSPPQNSSSAAIAPSIFRQVQRKPSFSRQKATRNGSRQICSRKQSMLPMLEVSW